ncbi:MAG: hypothetical protein JWL76_2140 [Thermoleophilia bacterium]|nr:hypothetical protein [Thermoleophilia bacterium]
MTKRATVEQLRKLRTKVVTINVDGEPAQFEISKIKAGQRRRLQTECIDDAGMLDLEQATRLSCEMCTVEPELTADDVEEMDLDVLLELAREISEHSGLTGVQQAASPADPEEGSAVVKSFRAEGSAPGVGVGVDSDSAVAADGLDA